MLRVCILEQKQRDSFGITQPPVRVLQKVFTEWDHFQAVIETGGVFIGALCLEADKANPPKPRVNQCYKCLKFGHRTTLCLKNKVGVADAWAKEINTWIALNPKNFEMLQLRLKSWCNQQGRRGFSKEIIRNEREIQPNTEQWCLFSRY